MPKTSPLPPPVPPESLPTVVTSGFEALAVAAIGSLCNLGLRHSLLATSVRKSECMVSLQLTSIITILFFKLRQTLQRPTAREILGVVKLQRPAADSYRLQSSSRFI